MNARTCFDILHIPLDASLDEAKESYKRLVKLWHPDQYANFPEKQMIAQEKLKEINVAYRDIVAVIKRDPVETEPPLNGKYTKRQPDENPQVKKKKRTSFWNQVALFINTNVLKSNRSEDPEKNDPIPPRAAQRDGATFAEGNSGTAPDFQQVLKRAIRNRRLGGSTRKRRGGSQHVRRRLGNAPSYRVETTTKRIPGDRVEKIAPVGRVKRIGGD